MKLRRIVGVCLCGFLLMSMPVTNFAAEGEEELELGESGVCFAINVDENIDFSKDDKVEVTLMNYQQQKEEVVEFSAQKALDCVPIDLSEGYYSVRNVKYIGNDPKLQKEDIAIAYDFFADVDYGIVYLAIGEVARGYLMQEYYDVLLISPDGHIEVNGEGVLGDHLNEAQRHEREELRAKVDPNKEYEKFNISKTEVEDAENVKNTDDVEDIEDTDELPEKTSKQAPEKGNLLWGLLLLKIP